jgi:DNA-nicking Smr family endonuclease
MSRKKKPRAKKNNKYDNLSKPQAEFDYHDLGVLTPKEIKQLADDFLDTCRNRGLSKVLFITGKGLHSRNGSPVVKPTLKKYLETLPFVLRVYESRRDRGGSGALEVILSD